MVLLFCNDPFVLHSLLVYSSVVDSLFTVAPIVSGGLYLVLLFCNAT